MGASAPDETTRGVASARWIGLVLGPLLAVVLYLVLPSGEHGLSDGGRATAACAALMATWWLTEAVPLAATALLPIVLFPLVGALPLGQTTARYAHELIFLFMGGFLLALAMQKWDLHKRIALTTVLIVGTRPRRLIAGFMIATAMLSMFVSNTATAVMLVPIGLSVIDLVDRRLHETSEDASATGPFATALMLAIAYAASIGGVGTLIGSPPNTLLAGFVQERYGVTISFAAWMKVGLPLVVVFLPIAWLYLTRIAHPIRLERIPGGRAMIREQRAALGPMSRGEWAVFIVFTCTALAWITRPQLVALGEHMGWGPLAALSDTGIAMLGGLVLFVIPVDWRSREFVMDWHTAERMPWGVLILFGGGLALAKAMEANRVDVFIGSAFSGAGGLPLIVLIALVAAVVIFLTELTSNTAVTSALLPVLAGVALELNIDRPLALLMPAAIAASFAFMLPVATPPNAIVFSSGRVSVAQMARAGLALNLVGIVLVTLATWALLPMLGIELPPTP
ncbi:MAG: DASS family sodium-coupled anion symporter [Phycisphaerales bacterium]